MHDLDALLADHPAERDVLDRHGFAELPFAALRARLLDGRAGPESNHLDGAIVPPTDGDVVALPEPGSAAHDALHARGVEAIRAGKVGVVVLAGGMATRFGGVIKPTVEVTDGQTFLDLKLGDVQRSAERLDARIPVWLMTSFATDAALSAHAARASTERVPVGTFAQYASLRLRPDGEVFHDEGGAPSLYAPGHGDLPFALRRAGVLEAFRAAGGELLVMSNVDNLGATLDPAIVGHHLAHGAAITAEVVRKAPGDKGGAPARVDGHLQIVEAFRFPEGFDQDAIDVFNTNTFVLGAAALAEPVELTWFAVRKQVDGRDAVQFERLVGELTAFHPSAYVVVARDGEHGRFQPVKRPEDLDARRAAIRSMLAGRGVL